MKLCIGGFDILHQLLFSFFLLLTPGIETAPAPPVEWASPRYNSQNTLIIP